MQNSELVIDSPPGRFGHKVTLISKGKAILFGGATGDAGIYKLTNDTYSFDTESENWNLLNV